MIYRGDTGWWTGEHKSRKFRFRAYGLLSFYLPMRDGVRIAVDLYLPRQLQSGERLPAILCQTRYHRRTAFRWKLASLFAAVTPFYATLDRAMARGYAFVITDVRGTGASFGSRQMEWSPDEMDDGVEVVNWIIRQPWSAGTVGVSGTSYVGTSAELLLTQGHPAVAAGHIRFAGFDLYADILCPGGARNRRFIEDWARLCAAFDSNDPRRLATTALGRLADRAIRGVAPVDEDADGDLLRQAIKEHEANYDIRAAALSVTFRDDLSESGIGIDRFSPHRFVDRMRRTGASVYSWSGYFDGGNTLSAVKRFINLSPSPGNRLVLGPWDHGGMQQPAAAGRPSRRSQFDQAGELLRFFDEHLKGVETGLGSEPPVHYFTMGEGVWKDAPTWPPLRFARRKLYFAPNRQLTDQAPAEDAAGDSFRVDPSATSGLRSRWASLVNRDRVKIGYPDRAVQDRKLLFYQSAPLAQAAEVTGHPIVTLHVRSTASDGLFIVYLEDITVAGEVLYVTEGVLRVLHRLTRKENPTYRLPDGVPYRTFTRADGRPLAPDEIAELVFDLQPVSYLFRPGHSIRVAIAGADQDNFEFVPAASPPWIKVLRNRSHPSHIALPIASTNPPIK